MAFSDDDYLSRAVYKLNVFSSVDNLPSRSFSSRSVRRFKDPCDALERILNKTTLTTQRVTHGNIIDLGGDMLSKSKDDNLEGVERSVQRAVEAAEARATRELRAALKRLSFQKDAERQRALEKQNEYAERRAQRISEQRDRAEAERMKDLIKKMNKEKEEAVELQRQEDERLKEIAVAEACAELTKKLKKEASKEKENAVEEALKKAEITFQEREKKAIAETRQTCEAEAREAAKKQALLHDQHVQRLNQKYDALQDKLTTELKLKAKLNKDFQDLQDDYKRFLDYTDGHFHSDYLMRLRHIGRQRILPKDFEDTSVFEL
ncbi:hypothetical protein LOTGIDRAFT_238264 [Lottia gigantea]|uniref:Uncharacterized protein n=1 Tax=Lottia gigantea TaxID=225164 RepID=V4CHH7_LOTGI|nr:hypothetical protein LOTGIDRAFT_238264 [Lottia gigantea]ESP01580.1 hypothetical protein LOTGIDRAFT_238264 [Lottia gigantea]